MKFFLWAVVAYIYEALSYIWFPIVMSYEKEVNKDTIETYDNSLEEGIENGSIDNKGLSWVGKLANFLNAETKGIDLVTDEEKVESSILEAGTMWLSANMVLATFALGVVGITVFELDFWSCMLTIVFFSLLGCLPVAFFSLFGVKLGLRQMVLSRFLLGDYCMRVFACLNLVSCVGFGAVNIMASAQLLNIVNNGALPPWAGSLILVIITVIVSFFGYRVIHIYEKWSWVPNVAVFIAIIARFHIAHSFYAAPMVPGATTAGNVLSFGSTVFGFATGWTTYASDYTVYQPRNTNLYRIFTSILLGLWIPLLFCLILGAACATGTLQRVDGSFVNKNYLDMYESNSVGGLVYAILVQDSLNGFGQFLCVVLSLSTVSNNIPNVYSAALSLQALWSQFNKVPRIVWTLIGNFVVLAICIPAYYKFKNVLTTFMDLIGYYLAIYQAIALSEHFIHRDGSWNYDYERFADKMAYPKGLAGCFAFCCGAAGVVIGMAQVWYVGSVAKHIGEFGGDVGFELAFVFSFVSYNATRVLEKKYIGR